MVEIIGVRFKEIGKIYYFDPCGISVKQGDFVIVETARGIECSEVMLPNREIDESKIVTPLRKVLRIATESDIKDLRENEKRAKEAFTICEKKIAEHKLDMKLIDVEYAFDRSKILFYFSADGRVDFRDLVKDLASVFRMRIELRQIGVRDEAKMYGGLGMCGRPLCCASFLDAFQPVSIKMAKEQGLSLNPTKISGTCGRLMCCLKYEQDAYEDLIRNTPKVEAKVETPDGVGTVVEVNLLRGMCKVRLENGQDAPKVYPKSELKIVGSGKTFREEYDEVKDEELQDEDLSALLGEEIQQPQKAEEKIQVSIPRRERENGEERHHHHERHDRKHRPHEAKAKDEHGQNGDEKPVHKNAGENPHKGENAGADGQKRRNHYHRYRGKGSRPKHHDGQKTSAPTNN